MSTSLAVRYSDVMQAERDFNNLTRSSTASSDCNDSTLSVRDARKRFEQMSSSASPSDKNSNGAYSKEAPAASKSRPAPPPPYKKRVSEPALRTLSTGTGASNSRVQRSSNQRSSGAATPAQDVGGIKAKSLKKSHSVKPIDLASTSSEANSTSSDSKPPSSTSKTKLFKRMNSESKGKQDSAAATSNGSTKSSRAVKNGGTSQNSTPSPTHKKFSSPLSSKKKRPSASSGSSQSSTPGEKQPTIRKSFSNRVLASSEERSVQPVLKEDDEGKVVGGSKPTTPRVIEDGELKLNLAEGKGGGCGLLHKGPVWCECCRGKSG